MLALYKDAHWIDPSTLELLGMVIERVRRLPVLVLITFRPEFQPPWAGQAHMTTLTMSRLDRRQGADLVARVTGDKPLPAAIVDQIVARTDGVPLFVEELTKTVLESDLLTDAGDHYELAGPLPPLAIPMTLHDSLLARLDHLAPAKEVAQIGAAIGREFSHALLAEVAERPEAELHAALDQLVQSELIFRRGTPSEATYTFKHALVRDAAYEAILKSRRRTLHGRIAAVLQRSPATAPDLLAQHLAGAGMAAAAARAYARAAQGNIARGAGEEAITQLDAAMRLLGDEPKDDERGRLEAELLVTRGDALRLVRGTAAPDTGAAYRRARELSEQLGGRRHRDQVAPPALSKGFYGECLYHYHRAELREAHALALRLLETSTREGDAISRELGLEMAALTSFSLGALASARGYFHQFGAPPTSSGPPEPVVSRRASSSDIYFACTMVLLGYPAQARERAEHAIGAAEQTREPFALALCVGTSLYLFELLRDRVRVRQSAERLRAAAEAAYMPHWASMADWFLALVMHNETKVAGSISCMRAGIRTSLDQGCTLEIPFYLALLAEALLASGRAEEARMSIDEALERSCRTAERWVEPELYRRRAQLRLAAPLQDLAGAVEISRGHSRPRAQCRPGFGSSGPPPISPAFGPSSESGRRRTTCWHQSTAGSPRASTPPTSRTPRGCSTSLPEIPKAPDRSRTRPSTISRRVSEPSRSPPSISAVPHPRGSQTPSPWDRRHPFRCELAVPAACADRQERARPRPLGRERRHATYPRPRNLRATAAAWAGPPS